jgi:pyridoxamine 5'-phosphate oxidase
MTTDPLRQFAAWLSDAEAAGLPLASAFALATAEPAGTPSVRMLLLRGFDVDGLRFFTNRESRKGRELAANPRAAAVFHWAPLDRQVRLAGTVTSLSDEESAA